jgi:hypothetical protein
MIARFTTTRNIAGTMKGVDIVRDAGALYRAVKLGDTITVEDHHGVEVLKVFPGTTPEGTTAVHFVVSPATSQYVSIEDVVAAFCRASEEYAQWANATPKDPAAMEREDWRTAALERQAQQIAEAIDRDVLKMGTARAAGTTPS